jgi:hypothetical protein
LLSCCKETLEAKVWACSLALSPPLSPCPPPSLSHTHTHRM